MHDENIEKLIVPFATTQAGACLTWANWQEAGVRALAFEMDALLIKPGIERLMKVGKLKAWYSWTGQVILDAKTYTADKLGNYTFRSPYDGAMIQISFSALHALILQLEPDYLIPSVDFQLQMQARKMDLPATIKLLTNDNRLLVTDLPAADAMQGKLYVDAGRISILDHRYTEDFTPIDEGCDCPCCKQAFTRAYLHHLLMQTPLLCQRFLIQHNVHYFQKKLQVENNPAEIRS